MTRHDLTGRKGLSPLIATILLIAFAVALGTLIISWTVEAPGSVEPCEEVEIALHPEGEGICYAPQQQRIQFVVRNAGDRAVSALLLTATDRDLNLKEQEIPADLEPGSAGRFELPFNTLTPSDVTATLVPLIAIEGGSERCVDHTLQRVSVPLC